MSKEVSQNSIVGEFHYRPNVNIDERRYREGGTVLIETFRYHDTKGKKCRDFTVYMVASKLTRDRVMKILDPYLGEMIEAVEFCQPLILVTRELIVRLANIQVDGMTTVVNSEDPLFRLDPRDF